MIRIKGELAEVMTDAEKNFYRLKIVIGLVVVMILLFFAVSI